MKPQGLCREPKPAATQLWFQAGSFNLAGMSGGLPLPAGGCREGLDRLFVLGVKDQASTWRMLGHRSGRAQRRNRQALPLPDIGRQVRMPWLRQRRRVRRGKAAVALRMLARPLDMGEPRSVIGRDRHRVPRFTDRWRQMVSRPDCGCTCLFRRRGAVLAGRLPSAPANAPLSGGQGRRWVRRLTAGAMPRRRFRRGGRKDPKAAASLAAFGSALGRAAICFRPWVVRRGLSAGCSSCGVLGRCSASAA